MRRVAFNQASGGWASAIQSALLFLGTGTFAAGATLVSDTGAGPWPLAVGASRYASTLSPSQIQIATLNLVNGEALSVTNCTNADWQSLACWSRTAVGANPQFDPRTAASYPGGLDMGTHASQYSGALSCEVLISDRAVVITGGAYHFDLLVHRVTASAGPTYGAVVRNLNGNGVLSALVGREYPDGSATIANGSPAFVPSLAQTGYGSNGVLVHPASKLHVLSNGTWYDYDGSVVRCYANGAPQDTLLVNDVPYYFATTGLWLK